MLYCSVDEDFAREVLDAYQARTGAKVSVVFDSEAGKTTGLVNRIISEAAGRSRADVFWSSEPFNTILLGRSGLLEPYDSPAAADIPDRYRDRLHRWTALAARARVLAYEAQSANGAETGSTLQPRGETAPLRSVPHTVPTRWEDLADPRFAGGVAFANPLFGTTRGHVAAMFALWGTERARRFLVGLRDGGAHVVDSNSAAIRALIAGRAKLAATDTDDVWVANRGGASLELIYPNMGDGGTLMIPCSVAIIRGARNAPAARRLVDFLVSAEVERMLALSDSRNFPVRPALREKLDMKWPPESNVSLDAVADAMAEATAAVREILIR